MKILYLRPEGGVHMDGGSAFVNEVRKLGEYSDITRGADMSDHDAAELIRKYDVLLTMWGSPVVPVELAENPGRLRYILNVTGEMRRWIDVEFARSRVVAVTNWGDALAYDVAEGAVALLFAALKNIPLYIKNAANGSVSAPDLSRQGTLYKTGVGIYGLGYIGRRFAEMLAPFGCEIRAYDPYLNEFPANVIKCETLEKLFSSSAIVAVHAGLSDETRNSVGAELLSLLPDGGIIINTARSGIIDFAALEKELVGGRLRAGLDLTPPNDALPPPGSPVRNLDNVILTAHCIADGGWLKDKSKLIRREEIALDNLRRFINGDPLMFIMDEERYLRST
jgi:phosphoglycerate dehydrogenase-like enzyme